MSSRVNSCDEIEDGYILNTQMSKRISIPVTFAFRCSVAPVQALLPSGFQVRIIATFTDANSGAPGVPVKRWVLAIFPCKCTAARTEKFLRSRYALLTFPPLEVRFGLCIGCNHAAQTRKETSCPTQRNPQRKSASTRYPQRSGGTRTRRASSTPSPLSAASRMMPASGSPLRPSTRATSCSWRRLPTWPTARSISCVPATATPNSLTKRLHNRRLGQGAHTGALPLFFIPQARQIQNDDALRSGMESNRQESRYDDLRQIHICFFSNDVGHGRNRGHGDDYRSTRKSVCINRGSTRRAPSTNLHWVLTNAASFSYRPQDLEFSMGCARMLHSHHSAAETLKIIASRFVLRFNQDVIRTI